MKSIVWHTESFVLVTPFGNSIVAWRTDGEIYQKYNGTSFLNMTHALAWVSCSLRDFGSHAWNPTVKEVIVSDDISYWIGEFWLSSTKEKYLEDKRNNVGKT